MRLPISLASILNGTQLVNMIHKQDNLFDMYLYIVDQFMRHHEAAPRLRSEQIKRLLDYFAKRHDQHEEMRLLEVTSNGGGNMSYKIRRRADDLDAELWGPDFLASGKGFVNCQDQTIDVWSMVMQ